MNIGKHVIEISDLDGHEMTVQVYAKFTRGFWVRYYIAIALMRMAGWILNLDLNVEVNES